MKIRSGTPAYLDSRGLVKLRLGNLEAAIADYDAALKTDPHNAWSLYARGIDEKRAGKADAAEADRKAALAVSPGVAKRAIRYGLDS